MRKLLLVLMLLPISLLANEGAFVLIDVSRSFPNEAIKLEAKGIILDFLQGRYNASTYSGNWKYGGDISDPTIASIVSGSPKQILKDDDFLVMIPFGDSKRYGDYQWTRIASYPQGMMDFYNQNFPALYTDNFTFINIAQSITVPLAFRFGFKEYYIFIMTDNLNDQTKSQSVQDQFDIDMTTCWDNHINSTSNNLLTLERIFNLNGKVFRYFVKVIRVTALSEPNLTNAPDGLFPPPISGGANGTSTGSTQNIADLKFTSFAGGKRNTPVILKQEDFSMTWSCENCNSDVKYTLQVQGIDGNKYKDKKALSTNSISLHLTSGLYKIFVSGTSSDGSTSIGSDTTYIRINSGGGLWFLWFILIAVLAVAGISFMRKQQQKMLKKKTGDNTSY